MNHQSKADILRKLRLCAAELSDPCYVGDKQMFAQRSYSRWAASELIKAVEESVASDVDPESVVVSFIQKMNWYSEYDHMFSIAYDICMYMYDQIFL